MGDCVTYAGHATIITNLIGGIKIGDKTHKIFINNDEFTIAIKVLCSHNEQILKIPISENQFKEIFKAIKNVLLVYFFSWMTCFLFQTKTNDFFGAGVYRGSLDSTILLKSLFMRTGNHLVWLWLLFRTVSFCFTHSHRRLWLRLSVWSLRTRSHR